MLSGSLMSIAIISNLSELLCSNQLIHFKFNEVYAIFLMKHNFGTV